MKILRITLSNIASLAGQHTVDFTQDPLRSAGLYAISGDTGSGKSSLLDAMCLALYGKTPRLKSQKNSLEKINDDEQQLDPRALLRRGTAEGLAEVAFVGVDGKSWTARWTVRRARKKASGRLQDVDRTLFQGHIDPAGDGTIESGGKKTEVDAAIQEKLGLTFEQFTRAVLLAQNEFAVFLKSDDKARAEILQALTGTGRFEDLSKAVFERCRTERRAIDDLKAQLNGGSILPEEERTEKESQLAEVEKHLANTNESLKQLESEQQWHKKLATHIDALTTTQAALDTATKALADSKPRKQQLHFTEQALRHAAPLKKAAENCAKKSETCINEAKDATEKLKQLEVTDKQIAVDFHAAETNLKNAQQQAQQLQPKLIQAAKLEESIRLQTDELKKSNDAFAEAKDAAESANDELQKTIKQQNDLKAVQQQLQQQQNEVHLYQPFADSADLWIERLNQAADTNRKLKAFAADLKANQLQLDKLQEEQQSATEAWETRSAEKVSAKQRLHDAEQIAKKFDRDDLSEQRNLAEQNRLIWDGFHTHLNQVHDRQQELNDCQQKLNNCVQLITNQDSELKQIIDTDLPAAQQAVDSQKASLQTVQAAISDEAIRLRTQLNHEEPCSVCGSIQHPYSAQPPSADQTAVTALQTLLQDTETKLLSLTKRQSQLEAELKSNRTRQQEFQTHQNQIKKELASFHFAHSDHADLKPLNKLEVSEQINAANHQRSELAKLLKQLQAKENRATAADKAVAKARTAFEDAEQKERDAHGAANTLNQTFITATTEQKNLQQRFDELETQKKNQHLSLQELFSQIPDSQRQFETDDETFRTKFTESVGLTGQVIKQLSEVDAQLKQLHDKLITIEPMAVKATQRLAARREHADTVQQQLADLQNQHSAVFEGRTAEAAIQEVAEAQASAEKQKQFSEKARSDSQKSLATATQEVVNADKQITLAEQSSKQAAEALTEWRTEFSASHSVELSESDLNAMLDRDEAWLAAEKDSLELLGSTVHTTTGQLATLQQQHKVHLDSRPSEQTLEEITASHQAAVLQQQSLQKSKDDVQKVLNIDDAQRKNNETVQQKITQQEATAKPWIRLNEVIGSSDGSAFRNIAQRHTLDILLQFSNHQLKLLSGRYRLERIANSLNLMVVDQDMADERRSIHSLSGGESFLVSLALALGLASLTSNRLKIESLFIDEGFGSLDPNTLDLAMNALVQLESQGRKVGIISHVTTMTDAISVQIKVKKGANGASTIDVPTITQVAEKPLAVKATPTQQSLFADPDSET